MVGNNVGKTTMVRDVEEEAVLGFLVDMIKQGSVLRVRQTIQSFAVSPRVIKGSESVQNAVREKIKELDGSTNPGDEAVSKYLVLNLLKIEQ